MKPRRPFFWVLLILFAAGSVFWLFHVPYRPDDLYRIVPENAVFMSHHRGLYERWDDFSTNPLGQSLLESAGVDVAEVSAWRDDPDWDRWIRKLLERDALMVHVPAMGPGRDRAWIMAGWIGRESIRLRWMLEHGLIAGVHKIERHAGGTYWLVPAVEGPAALSIGVVEGMLIGVFSADPHAARHVLDVYDGIAARHPLADRGTRTAAACPGWHRAPDYGWWIGPGWDYDEMPYAFALERVDAQGIRGAVCIEQPAPVPVLPPQDLEVVARLWGPLPFVVAGLHPAAAESLLFDLLQEPGERMVRDIYARVADGPVLLAVTGGEYGGAFAGIAVPAITMAWPAPDEAAAWAYWEELLDHWNAAYRWGLVMSPSPVGRRQVMAVESTADTFYADFRARDRLALAWVDGWMVASSNVTSLTRLVGRYGRVEALVEADEGGWQGLLRSEDAWAGGLLDIRKGALTLRLALSAWSLKLLFEDPRESRELRQTINELRAWIDVLEPLGQATFTISTEDDERMRVQFLLGAQE